MPGSENDVMACGGVALDITEVKEDVYEWRVVLSHLVFFRLYFQFIFIHASRRTLDRGLAGWRVMEHFSYMTFGRRGMEGGVAVSVLPYYQLTSLFTSLAGRRAEADIMALDEGVFVR